MSRLGQLHPSALKRVSELLLIGGSAVRRGPFLAQTCVIQTGSGNKRYLSALTPVICCRAPDEPGPSPPPPSSGNDRGQGRTTSDSNNISNRFSVKRILTLVCAFVILNLINLICFNMYWEWHFNEK